MNRFPTQEEIEEILWHELEVWEYPGKGHSPSMDSAVHYASFKILNQFKTTLEHIKNWAVICEEKIDDS